MQTNERLFYVLLSVFVLWLAMFVALIWMVLQDTSKVDPILTLVTGLGLGLVTEFFLMALTLSWQFFFRKKETSNPLPSPSP